MTGPLGQKQVYNLCLARIFEHVLITLGKIKKILDSPNTLYNITLWYVCNFFFLLVEEKFKSIVEEKFAEVKT